jgi:hypothetical protein
MRGSLTLIDLFTYGRIRPDVIRPDEREETGWTVNSPSGHD